MPAALDGGTPTSADARTLPGVAAHAARRGRWVRAAVCLGPFVTQLATFALSPFPPFVAADLGTSVAALGQIPALTMLVAAALGLVVGPLADRIGHRPTLVAGVVGSSLSALATATASAPSLLVLGPVALVGTVGRSIGLPVAQAVVGVRFAGPALRRGIGLIQVAGTLARIVGIPLATGGYGAVDSPWLSMKRSIVALRARFCSTSCAFSRSSSASRRRFRTTSRASPRWTARAPTAPASSPSAAGQLASAVTSVRKPPIRKGITMKATTISPTTSAPDRGRRRRQFCIADRSRCAGAMIAEPGTARRPVYASLCAVTPAAPLHGLPLTACCLRIRSSVPR